MKTLTYLSALLGAIRSRDLTESGARGYGMRAKGATGIAVNTDAVALKWQKYDRQSTVFERALRSKLDEQAELIALQAAELDGFMRVMQEAHDGI